MKNKQPGVAFELNTQQKERSHTEHTRYKCGGENQRLTGSLMADQTLFNVIDCVI